MPDLINTPLTLWPGKKFVTKDGDELALGTKHIEISEGCAQGVCNVIARDMGKGFRILLVGEKRAKDSIIKNIIPPLEASEYKVSGVFADIARLRSFDFATEIASSVEEDTRIIISAGGRVATEAAKMIAYHTGLPHCVIMTVPDYDGFLLPFSVLRENGYNELFVCNPPVYFFADLSYILSSEREDIASGFGCVLCKLLAIFDWHVASIFNNENFYPDLADAVMAAVKKMLEASEGLIRLSRPAISALTQCLAALSALCQMHASPRLSGGGEELCAKVIDMLNCKGNRAAKRYGEDLFVSAQVLFKAYPIMLAAKSKGVLAPPDNARRLELICEMLGVAEVHALKKITPYMESEQYQITQYKLNEFGDELAELLGGFEQIFIKYSRILKRIYPDGGYSLKKYLTEDDLRAMISLAPDIDQKFTLLTAMKQIGMLDDYL